jgi:hypothetical protein
MAAVAGSDISVDTPAGAAWIEKYLHPPSATKAVYAGIPDLNGTPSVNLEYRLERTVPASGNPEVYYLPPSIIRQGFAFEISPAGTFTQDPLSFIANSQVSAREFSTNAESYRMAYRSTTIYQDSTGFNNNGMLYAAQFRPNVSMYTDRLFGSFVEKYRNHQGFKKVLDAMSEKFTANLDTYEIVHGMDKMNLGRKEAPKPKLPSQGNALQIISLGKIPTSATDVMMRSPRSRAAKAVEGAFLVHQFSEPTQSYKSLSRTYKDDSGSEAIAYSIFSVFEYEAPDGTLHLSSFETSDGGSNCPDLEWYDMTWGMVMYVPGPASANTPVADLIVKTIMGVDVQPTAGSMFAAVAKEAPLYDQQALRLGAMMRQRMPDALPAAANDFGSIMATVLKFAPMVINGIKSIFTPKASVATAKKVAKETVVQEEKKKKPLERAQAKMKTRKAAITAGATAMRKRNVVRKAAMPMSEMPGGTPIGPSPSYGTGARGMMNRSRSTAPRRGFNSARYGSQARPGTRGYFPQQADYYDLIKF